MTNRVGVGVASAGTSPEVPRPVRVLVSIVLLDETPLDLRPEYACPASLLSVYRSRSCDGSEAGIAAAYREASGAALHAWEQSPGKAPPLPASLREKVTALEELLEIVRVVIDVEGSPQSDRSGATDQARISRLGEALERYEALP